jgi:hypothetical protein
MKDPSRSSTSPSIINEDVIINGHSHEDDNPFAEYMWMENEEEFNRQVSFLYRPVLFIAHYSPQIMRLSLALTCVYLVVYRLKCVGLCATTPILLGC